MSDEGGFTAIEATEIRRRLIAEIIEVLREWEDLTPRQHEFASDMSPVSYIRRLYCD